MAYETISQAIEASTLTDGGATVEKIRTQAGEVSEAVSRGASDIVQAMSDAIVLGLETKWATISLLKPAKTEHSQLAPVLSMYDKQQEGRTDSVEFDKNIQYTKEVEATSSLPDRYERQNLCSLRLGDYWMPMSQSFTLRAKKRLNVSSLVDGIDIIQQTRKEAKTIDCQLRITLRENQPNLEVQNDTVTAREDMVRSLTVFSRMLQELYENDAVFKIENQVINDTFGVNYAIISEYEFRPKLRSNIFDFSLSLTEVKYGDNVITFDVRTLGGASNG